MNFLLDTHALLWIIMQDLRTPKHWLDLVEDPFNTIYISIASIWEIAIKSGTGKLRLDFPFTELIQDHIIGRGVRQLPIQNEHLILLETLPHNHRDPFDRLIIAQSKIE